MLASNAGLNIITVSFLRKAMEPTLAAATGFSATVPHAALRSRLSNFGPGLPFVVLFSCALASPRSNLDVFLRDFQRCRCVPNEADAAVLFVFWICRNCFGLSVAVEFRVIVFGMKVPRNLFPFQYEVFLRGSRPGEFDIRTLRRCRRFSFCSDLGSLLSPHERQCLLV